MNGDRFSWWSNLRHGGLLLDTPRLTTLIPTDPPELSAFNEDRLRRRLTQFQDDAAAHRGEFVAFMLEAICGFARPLGEWYRGAEVKIEWSRKAITGESVRPRHLWIGMNAATLPVFIDDQHRLGIGKGRRVISQVLGWLRQGKEQLALVTNGGEWRLVFAGLDYEAFCQWNVDTWFAEGSASRELGGFRALLAPDHWTPPKEGEPCPLLAAVNNSRKGQADLSQILGERVRQAAELLIQAHTPALKEHIDSLEPQDIYRAAVRMIMRLVVVLFAESREGLLVRDNPVFHSAYSLQGLREQLERISNYKLVTGVGAYPRILSLLRLIYEGSSHAALPVPAYGGELFAPGRADDPDGMKRALQLFETATFGEHQAVVMTDYQVQQILDLLTRTKVKIRQGRANMLVPAPVDFSTLDSEYIGILYEGLLDFELRCAVENEPIVFLAVGNQPALPLTTLLGMDDRAIKNLLEKMKDTSSGDEEEADGEDAEAEESAEVEDTDDAQDDADEETEEIEADAGADSTAEPAADDPRFSLRQRAEEWAIRACRVGNLVARPRGRQTPETQMQYERALASKARQLVVKVVLPGEWYLVRWGGTRKGSGTFYTRPQLAIPTVHRTLRPLAYDPPLGADGQPDTNASVEAWKPKSPEQILKLKVCDPACGSGSFPLSALRFLTNALYESLVVHGRVRDHGGRAMLDLIRDEQSQQMLSSEALPCRPEDDEFEQRTRAILRRYVVERCIYGVDLDPLAVELCRLSLWIETMDRSLPLTFLNHKVKCGNSLVGAWFDQFLHYPAMAWEREGGDKNHTNGVHFPKEGWTKAIKAFKARVKPDLITFIDGGTLNYYVDLTTISCGHDAAEAALAEIHALGINQVAERAARYDALEESPEFQQLKAAFDLWCALWFWPADQLDHAPLPTEFAAGEIDDEGRRIARDVAGKLRFFHWELSFPDVFNASSHGFDAILGNPPWETLQPNSKEFFSAIDPLFRSYGKQEALNKQKEYFERDIQIERNWLAYNASFKAISEWVKHAGNPYGDRIETDAEGRQSHELNLGDRGRNSFASSERRHARWKRKRAESTGYVTAEHSFRHQGSGKAYTYKMFVEQCYTLLADNGRLGVIVPAGIYADHGAAGLRSLLLRQSRWEWMFGLINWRKIFQSVYYRFKFCICICQRGTPSTILNAAFDRYKVEEWEEPANVLVQIEASQLASFSPKSLAFLETRTQKDVVAAQKVFAHCGQLGSPSADGWGIKYAQGDFNMTSDSKLFPPLPKWEEWGYRSDEYSRWIHGPWQPIDDLWRSLGVAAGSPGQPSSAAYHGRIDSPDIIRTIGHLRCSQPPYDRLPVSRADIPAGVILSREATHFIRETDIPTERFTDAAGRPLTFSIKCGEATREVAAEGPAVAVPLYEGRMIGPLKFTEKGWVSGKARSAVWREMPPDELWLEPQYLVSASVYQLSVLSGYIASVSSSEGPKAAEREFERLLDQSSRDTWWVGRASGVSIMDVTSATNARTTVCALTTLGPNGHSAPKLRSSTSNSGLAGVLSTFVWDRMVRLRTNGVHLIWAILEESPLPKPANWLNQVSELTLRLNATGVVNAELTLRHRKNGATPWRALWALTPHERLRVRCTLDAIVAVQFGLDRSDYRQIMLDCDHPKKGLTQLAYSGFDPKGFWRVDKDKHPELRHTILSLLAFENLQDHIASCGGDLARGIEIFCNQNDGEGWLLPETLRLADYGLGHDDRALGHQPVRECFGPRFYDWQFAQSAEESWRECQLHARNLLGLAGYEAFVSELNGNTPPAPRQVAPVSQVAAKRSPAKELPLFQHED